MMSEKIKPKVIKKALCTCFVLISIFILTGCFSDANTLDETSKYTNEIAQAIESTGSQLSIAVFVGFFINAMSK